jgi:DNA-binding winged helix-turn-helix (wHTH) protein/tetratricopeptide (TPR) repeat protein
MKRFHSLRLDPLNQCLWRGEQRVSLPPKAFDVLRYLVEHAGRLVTHDEILDALWPKACVNQEVVKKYILGIRKVLGDRRDEPIFIATFPRRGYQFVAEVIDEDAAAASALSLNAANKVVGRRAELAGLDSTFEQVLRGHRRVIFVTGEAGIGKSTLVDVFQQRAASRPGVRIARGQCVEGFGGKEAYYPMLEALGQLTRDGDRNPAVQILAARAPTWLIQFPSLVKPEQRQALQREILGATRERMVREICEALEVLTASHPLLLVFEDLHWVDPSTLDLISALARRREAAKLLLLCTYRPADVALSGSPLKGLKQDLHVHRLCDEVALGQLAEPEVAQYLAAEFAGGGTLPSDLANLIYRRSGGHALFMVGITQDMIQKGLIVQDEGGWRLTTALADIDPGVPETLQRMLDEQFDQLSALEQRVLKSASVAAERFSVWAITPTLDLAPEQIEDVCEGLAERQQFIQSAAIEELANGSVSAHYEFRHSLYRQAIYRRLSDVSRSKLHRALGERLESLCAPGSRELASELALHFERGRDYERAVRYLMLAAENAAARFAYPGSIQVLLQALKLVPRIATRVGAELEVQVLEVIGDAHYALGAMADSAKAYAAAAERAAHARIGAAQVSALTSLMRPFGLIDPERGIAAIDEAAQVSRGLNDPLLLARTEMLAAAVRLLYRSWCKEDADNCASAQQTLRQLGDSGTPPYHQMMYAYVQVLQGRYSQAIETFEAFIPKMDETTNLMAYFFALSGKTVALLHLGRFGEVLRIVQARRALAEQDGYDPWLFNFREAWLRTFALDFAGARQLCEIITHDAGYPTGQPEAIARIAAGYAELEQGKYDQAIEYFRQVRDPQITPKFFLHWYWRMTAQLGLSDVWLASGDLPKARSEAESLLQSALSTADPDLQALAWELKTRVAIAGHDWSEAQGCIEQALAVVEKFEVPVAAWRVQATAWDVYRHAKDDRAAEMHRARAEAHILAIANSFAADEPLRQSFLAAPAVRRILFLLEPRAVAR